MRRRDFLKVTAATAAATGLSAVPAAGDCSGTQLRQVRLRARSVRFRSLVSRAISHGLVSQLDRGDGYDSERRGYSQLRDGPRDVHLR